RAGGQRLLRAPAVGGSASPERSLKGERRDRPQGLRTAAGRHPARGPLVPAVRRRVLPLVHTGGTGDRPGAAQPRGRGTGRGGGAVAPPRQTPPDTALPRGVPGVFHLLQLSVPEPASALAGPAPAARHR